MFVHRSLLPVVAVCAFALGACSAGSGMPGAAQHGAPETLEANHGVASPLLGAMPGKAKTFGVGLEGQADAMSDKGTYSFHYCQDKGSSSCPTTHPGLRNAKFADAKALRGKDGMFRITQSATSALGLSTYANDAEAGSTDQSGAVEGARGEEWLNWADTLHVTSKTLAKGSPVTVSVALTLDPSVTNVTCDPNNLGQATLTFTASGQDTMGGSELSVVGGCVNGAFVYLSGPGSGVAGTSDTGVISTSVGSSVNLTGFGHLVNTVCLSFGGTCVGSYAANLSGTASWQITGITKGASYKTDSGSSYH